MAGLLDSDRVSRIENWTLAPGQTWWLTDSSYGSGWVLAHVAVNGRTLCGRRLSLSMAALTEKRMVCGNCERVLEAKAAS